MVVNVIILFVLQRGSLQWQPYCDLTNLIFPAKQFTQLFAVRFIRFLRDHRDSRLFQIRFMRFVLFLFVCAWSFILEITIYTVFAVRFMRCAWKSHPFQSKCVCISYCFYADLTIYEFCSTLKRIRVHPSKSWRYQNRTRIGEIVC